MVSSQTSLQNPQNRAGTGTLDWSRFGSAIFAVRENVLIKSVQLGGNGKQTLPELQSEQQNKQKQSIKNSVNKRKTFEEKDQHRNLISKTENI